MLMIVDLSFLSFEGIVVSVSIFGIVDSIFVSGTVVLVWISGINVLNISVWRSVC